MTTIQLPYVQLTTVKQTSNTLTKVHTNVTDYDNYEFPKYS
jgi:hypothetical protein